MELEISGSFGKSIDSAACAQVRPASFDVRIPGSAACTSDTVLAAGIAVIVVDIGADHNRKGQR
jgi:hypothetical protein